MICPKCQGRMRTVDRQGLHIEQCERCRGIFLDHGELEQAVSAEQRFYGGAGAGYAAPRGYGDSPKPYRGHSGGYGDSPKPYRAGHSGHYADSPKPYRAGHSGHYRDSPRPYKSHKKGFLGELFG